MRVQAHRASVTLATNTRKVLDSACLRGGEEGRLLLYLSFTPSGMMAVVPSSIHQKVLHLIWVYFKYVCRLLVAKVIRVRKPWCGQKGDLLWCRFMTPNRVDGVDVAQEMERN